MKGWLLGQFTRFPRDSPTQSQVSAVLPSSHTGKEPEVDRQQLLGSPFCGVGNGVGSGGLGVGAGVGAGGSEPFSPGDGDGVPPDESTLQSFQPFFTVL